MFAELCNFQCHTRSFTVVDAAKSFDTLSELYEYLIYFIYSFIYIYIYIYIYIVKNSEITDSFIAMI
jgi:hypothetical protein